VIIHVHWFLGSPLPLPLRSLRTRTRSALLARPTTHRLTSQEMYVRTPRCYTDDTVADVTVVLADVGGAAAKLINVCSYPSEVPGSAPSECVITPNNGFLTIVKSADPNDGTAFKFNLGTGQTSQNGTSSWTINGSGSVQLISFAPATTYDLSEVVPSGWSLGSASCVLQTSPTARRACSPRPP